MNRTCFASAMLLSLPVGGSLSLKGKALLILLGSLALLLLVLLFIRVTVSVTFGNGLTLWIRVGSVRLRLYPKRPRLPRHLKKPLSQKRHRNETVGAKQSSAKQQEKKKGTLTEGLTLIHAVLSVLGRHHIKLTKALIVEVKAELTVGRPDAAETALQYGRLCALCGGLTPLLYRLFTVRSCALHVGTDFLAGKTVVRGSVGITSTLWRLLRFGISFALTMRRERRRNGEWHLTAIL